MRLRRQLRCGYRSRSSRGELVELVVQDPENDCSYSWSGIGYPLAEVDDIGELNNRAIVQMQQKLSQTENYFEN